MSPDFADVVARTAAMLGRLFDPSAAVDLPRLVADWRPQDDDYPCVFVPDAAARARTVYGRLWQASPSVARRAAQTQLLLTAAHSEDFAGARPRAQGFPGGYLRIADKLQPGVPWFCWKFVEPGRTVGSAYDGLVYLDGRWAWFPKPYRAVAGSNEMGYWSE